MSTKQAKPDSITPDFLQGTVRISAEEEQGFDNAAYSGAAEDIAENQGLNTPDHSDSTQANQATPADLEKAEEHPEAPTSSRGEQSEATNFKDKLYAPDTPPHKTFRSRMLNKKTAIGGSIVGILVGSAFGILSFVSGPMQIVQFAKFLENIHFSRNDNSSESRVGRFFEYFRTTNDPSKRNVGYTVEKLTDRYMKGMVRDGVTMNFENPNNDGKARRIQSLSIDRSTDGGERTFQRLKAQGYDIGDDGFLDFRKQGNITGTRDRRAAVRIAADVQGKGRVSSAVSKRLLISRAGVDFHPLQNVRRTASEKLVDWRLKRKEDRADTIRNGSNPADGHTLDGEKDKGVDEKGNPIEIENEINNAEARAATPDVNAAKASKSPLDRLKLAGKLVGGGAAALGALCTVKSVGNDVVAYQHSHIILPLIRTATSIVAMGSQIMAGQDVNFDVVGEVADDMYDEETKTSVMSAPAVRAAQGQSFTDQNDVTVKPSAVGEKPELFDIIDKIPFMSTACKAQSGILGAIKKVPVVGGIVGAYENAAAWGMDAALAPLGLSMGKLMEMVVSALAGDIVDPFAKGAQLGGNAMIGSLLAANDAAVATGGVLLDTVSMNELNKDIARKQRDEFAAHGLFYRLFNAEDPDSLVSRAVVQNPSFASGGNILRSFTSLPFSIGSLLGRSASLLSPQASAVSTFDYAYGVGVYSYSPTELADENYADPYANADFVEAITDDGTSRLETLNEKYGKCFSTTIDPVTFTIRSAETPTYETLTSEDCTKDKDSEEFIRYRFYLLDTVTAKSLACHEGLEEIGESACTELGFGASAILTSGNGSNNGSSAKYIPDCSVNGGNAAIACTAIDQLLGIPYSMSQRALPTNPEPKFLDCSSFVSMSIYRTFGTDLGSLCSVGFRTNSNFQQIDVHDIQPGDMVGRGTACAANGGRGHIGIVISYDQSTKSLVTAETDSSNSLSRVVTTKGLAIDSKGSYEWAIRYVGPKKMAVQ